MLDEEVVVEEVVVGENPSFLVDQETVTFYEVDAGEAFEMELPEVQTIPENTLIASYASELGAAANFASFDTESGKLTIEEGDTNESHVG